MVAKQALSQAHLAHSQRAVGAPFLEPQALSTFEMQLVVNGVAQKRQFLVGMAW